MVHLKIIGFKEIPNLEFPSWLQVPVVHLGEGMVADVFFVCFPPGLGFLMVIVNQYWIHMGVEPKTG